MIESSGPLSGADFAIIFVAVALTVALVAGIHLSMKRGHASATALVARLTPTQTLAEAVVVSGGTVELRARATQGSHKVWLEVNVPIGTGRWSAVATVAHRVSTSQASYRDVPAEAGATKEGPVAFGDDGDGVSTIGATAAPRTGALTIPQAGTGSWLQLVTLPPCPEGAEIFASVAITGLTTPVVSFRAFLGVSEA